MTATITYTNGEINLTLPANTEAEIAAATTAITAITTLQGTPTTPTTDTTPKTPRKPRKSSKGYTAARWTEDENEILDGYIATHGRYTSRLEAQADELAKLFDRTRTAIINRWNTRYDRNHA